MVAGTVSLVVGAIGIYLPGLPTTPFLLLALACYLRGSERMYRWLLTRPVLQRHLRPVLEKKALPRKVKVISLTIAWAVLGFLALFIVESLFGKGLLIALAVAKTGLMLRIPTLERE